MSGYINRDDFVAYERKQHCDICFMSDDHGLDPCPVCWLYSLLKEAEDYPAADVRPVVRGHKVTHNRPMAGYWASGKLDGGWDGMEGRVWVEPIMDNPVDYCSECGKRLDDTFQNFCPNCGCAIEGTET